MKNVQGKARTIRRRALQRGAIVFSDYITFLGAFVIPVIIMLGAWGDISYREYKQARKHMLQSFP